MKTPPVTLNNFGQFMNMPGDLQANPINFQFAPNMMSQQSQQRPLPTMPLIQQFAGVKQQNQFNAYDHKFLESMQQSGLLQNARGVLSILKPN